MTEPGSGSAAIEGQHLELKGALTWNARRAQEDGDLRLGVARTIAAFANSDGGTLYIGVADDGTVHGIDEEVNALFGEFHLDRFEGLVLEHLKNLLWPNPIRAYTVKFEQRASQWLCVIDVRPQRGITYVKAKSGKGSFEHLVFVRNGNRTEKLVDLDRDRFVVERCGGVWST